MRSFNLWLRYLRRSFSNSLMYIYSLKYLLSGYQSPVMVMRLLNVGLSATLSSIWFWDPRLYLCDQHSDFQALYTFSMSSWQTNKLPNIQLLAYADQTSHEHKQKLYQARRKKIIDTICVDNGPVRLTFGCHIYIITW